MLSRKQNLKELLAQGNLESALDELIRLTQNVEDADLRQRVLTLSGQFAALKKQQLTGLIEDKDYLLQRNRITAAVAEIVDNLGNRMDGLTLSETIHSRLLKKWATMLAVLASMAGITGYTLRNVLWPTPPSAPAEGRAATELGKTDTIIVKAPAAPPTPAGKNNVNIQVKDKAKIGTIITGDSNKIDVKQDF